MNNFFRAVLHIGAVAAQVALHYAPSALGFVPPPYNLVASAGVGLLQAIVDLRKKPAPVQ